MLNEETRKRLVTAKHLAGDNCPLLIANGRTWCPVCGASVAYVKLHTERVQGEVVVDNGQPVIRLSNTTSHKRASTMVYCKTCAWLWDSPELEHEPPEHHQ